MTIKNLLFAVILLVSCSMITSCATIIGGTRYNAKVYVPNHPDAKIRYQGLQRGEGEANFRVKRKDANQFSVTIEKDGCATITRDFTKRKFRGWSLVGTLVTWTWLVGPVPVPFGVILDGATGSWWSPDSSEKGVTKNSIKDYSYRIDYTGCETEQRGEYEIY